MNALRRFFFLLATFVLVAGTALARERPNVLFISIDDLNDWVGCLGGHPQARTPNLDRLAASGVLFTNAHCPAPACNPSRTAIMTGISPHRSGLYQNGQKMREVLPDAELIPKYFSRRGYWSGGSGKLLHYFIDARSWDEYYPAKETENPFPPHIPWGKRPKSLPRGGPWQYVETDWHAFDVTDDEFGGDSKVADWVSARLTEKRDEPFFLACGIYRPHEPWFVPTKYFDLFPLDEVQLPPGYKEDDLDDLPPAGKKRGPNRYFAHIRKHGQWRRAVQAYLASIAYADAMLGRVIDALDRSPRRDDTIVALWSDHGWHLGEKQHWQKFTAWRAATRVPLIVRVPRGAPGLLEGTRPGSTCARPVNLLSLFPTLIELCGLPVKTDNDGPSLVPLLRNADAPWPHVSLTHVNQAGTFGLSTEDWRYIRYAEGGEELYDIRKDPHEWANLAEDPEHAAKLAELRALAPETFAPLVPPKDASLPRLVWHPAGETPAPASRPDGPSFDVVFFNDRKTPVKVFWVDRKGSPRPYGGVAPGARKRQQTRPGAVWQIADESGRALGHFVVGDRSARAVIPAEESESRRQSARRSSGAQAAKSRPNIVFLMADDWSWPHASILGDPAVETPHFDRVAREGVLFQNAFVSTPSCTPSRLSLLTGQQHWRLKEGDSLGGSLREEYGVYTEMLQKSGYRIGRYGKGVWPSRHTFRNRDSFGERFRSFGEFLEDRKPDEPFCYWHGGQDPHRPYKWRVGVESGINLEEINVPDCLPDNETVRTDLADYYWEVQRFDREVGKVLGRLERMGELESTIVVVSGDNGMPFPRCKSTLYDLGTRVPLAVRWGEKVKGHRIVEDFVSLCDLAPTFLEAAGLPPGESMTGSSLLPILLSGKSGRIEPARTHVLTGLERHVYLHPSRALRNRDFLYIRNFNPSEWRAGEVADHNPKYDFTKEPWPTERGAFSFNIDPSPSKQFLRLHRDDAGVRQIAALAFSPRPGEELYDLKSDPAQTRNLAAEESYRRVLSRLRGLLDAELLASADPRSVTTGYDVRTIEGWTVLVHEELLSQASASTDRALKLLEQHLIGIRERVPPQAVAHLRRVPLWFSPEYQGIRPRAEYHPHRGWLRRNERNPAMANGVEFSNIPIFEKETVRMPVFVLHELAHAYHDQILGFDHAAVLGAYRAAVASKSYEKVRRAPRKAGGSFSVERAYAMTDHKEYFAETSEAFFGVNDFYPFNREELERHDPVVFKLLSELWGVPEGD